MSEPTPPQSQSVTPTTHTPEPKTIPMKWVGIGAGALLILGLTFWAGMAYENNRIENEIRDAFSGFDEDLEDSFGDADTSEEPDEEDEVEQVELTENSPVVLSTDSGEGEVTITLLSTTIANEASADDVLTRNVSYQLKVQNTGSTAVDPSTSAHFETDEGQVLDFSGVLCDEGDLPDTEIDPGQFVQGCESSDIPDDAGRLVFDGFDSELYLVVPARS